MFCNTQIIKLTSDAMLLSTACAGWLTMPLSIWSITPFFLSKSALKNISFKSYFLSPLLLETSNDASDLNIQFARNKRSWSTIH